MSVYLGFRPLLCHITSPTPTFQLREPRKFDRKGCWGSLYTWITSRLRQFREDFVFFPPTQSVSTLPCERGMEMDGEAGEAMPGYVKVAGRLG